ncbi:MAG: DNA recombination protein RmuC [Aliivibrio sp.]|uniref:DNA recombination protein RmuC n=1 Tax=Aliivibrio sp. TaxID=1872443 RepID=UPI001A54CDC8|nr:DNA recombination protein RmuC [Aliivibrio sp.]
MLSWIPELSSEFFISIAIVIVLSLTLIFWFKQRYEQRVNEMLQQGIEASAILKTRLEQNNRLLDQRESEIESLEVERERRTEELRVIHGHLMAAQEKNSHYQRLVKERDYLTERVEESQRATSELEADLREQDARHQAEFKSSKEKILLLENAEQRLKDQFEILANKLFEQKSKTVDEQNRISLEGLLLPLKQQLDGFKKQVTDSFGYEAKERHTLVHEIRSLQQLNIQMSQEAVNLTNALKGDNKQQGNWGEVVLARVLQESGLREGHEYQTQISLENENGKRYQPDVIVHLPQEQDVVVDSKMTLIAYERYFHADNTEEKEAALRDHLTSMRAHVRGLGQKDYHKLKGLRSLDYVLMFIPIESAFQLAIEADPSLINDAMEQNIIIVSPTTLLVALRTINNLWRNERQNQNAQVIAERASKLYDKVRLFVDDMNVMGSALEKASSSYQGAMNKLVSGRGNIIRQTEGFKELGVEVKRDISRSVVEQALGHDKLQNFGTNEADKVN